MKKKLRIAIISPEFPPYTNWGGVARFNQNLAELISTLGHEVYVFTYDPVSDYKKTISNTAYTTYFIPFKTPSELINLVLYSFPIQIGASLLKKVFPNTLFTITWNFFALLYFIKFNQNNKIDVIHTPTYHSPALFIKFFHKKIPLINHVQGPQQFLNLYEMRTFDKSVKAFIENFYLKRFSNRVISCSNNVHMKICELFPSINNISLYLPNFIETSEYNNTFEVDNKNIIFIGRLEYRKGVDLLLNSFISLAKSHNNLNLYLIGENGWGFGDNKDKSFLEYFELLDIKADIKNRIFIFPRIDNKNTLIKLLLQLKGIAVFPSRYEPFGFVTIEAMAMGYIVVAGKNGGASEIIKHSHDGFLTNSTQTSILKNLRKILSLNQKQLKKISKCATLKVELKFSQETLKIAYSKLYAKELLT